MDRTTNERRNPKGGSMNTCKHAVRSILIAGLMVLGMGVVKRAEAAPNPDTMVVSVTPGGFTYAVVITSPVLTGTTGYDFTQVNLGATTISTLAIVVKSSGTISEFFSLAISNSQQDAWTPVSGTPGFKQYRMMAYFSSGQPADGTFVDSLTTGVPGTASGFYEQGTSKTDPANSPNLWLRLTMPSSVPNQNAQSMVLTVNGQNN